MDVDQSARTNAQEYFGVKDPDYYEFEGGFKFSSVHLECKVERLEFQKI
jgi:hypothetical protein